MDFAILNVSLENPWALLGLLVLALPFLVPNFVRQKPVLRPWGSVLILQRAIRKTQRANRITDRLLLILRMALLAFLILGLAEPVIHFSKQKWYSRKNDTNVPLRILIVDGDPNFSAATSRNFATYLKLALDSANEESKKPYFETEIVPADSWNPETDSRWDHVVLSELAVLNTTQSKFLDTFSRSGNGVMVFLGKRTDAEHWNRLFFEPMRLNAFLEDVRNADAENGSWNAHGYEHEIVQKFKAVPNNGLLERTSGFFVPIHFSTAISNSHWSSVISFADGYPFLAAYQSRSRCLLFYTTSPLENGLVAHPTFVPLMLESVFWLRNQAETNRAHDETHSFPLTQLCFLAALLFFTAEIVYFRLSSLYSATTGRGS